MRAINIQLSQPPGCRAPRAHRRRHPRAVEAALRAQGNGETVIEPRVHLVPESSDKGHFNVLRGVVKPLGVGGREGGRRLLRKLQAGPALGGGHPQPVRSGQRHSARHHRRDRHHRHAHRRGDRASAPSISRAGNSRILGHVGARGTAYWNVRLLDHLFDFDEIRVHSRRPESRDAFAARLAADLGKPVRSVDVVGGLRAWTPTSSSKPRACRSRNRC